MTKTYRDGVQVQIRLVHTGLTYRNERTKYCLNWKKKKHLHEKHLIRRSLLPVLLIAADAVALSWCSCIRKTDGEAHPAAVRLLAFRLVPSGQRSAVGLPLGLRAQGCAQGQDQQHSITQTATSFRHHHQRGPFGAVWGWWWWRWGGGGLLGEIFMSGAFTHTPMRLRFRWYTVGWTVGWSHIVHLLLIFSP